MATAARKNQNAIDVPALAARELAANTGDVAGAAKAMETKARANPALWMALTDSLLPQACYDAIRAQCRKERRTIWTAPNYTPGGNGGRVVKHALGLLDFPLPGGKRLRDATADEVRAAAQFYHAQAATMARQGRWLDLVAAQVAPNCTVGQVLDETKLGQLQSQA
jgi:hypothetical protein